MGAAGFERNAAMMSSYTLDAIYGINRMSDQQKASFASGIGDPGYLVTTNNGTLLYTDKSFQTDFSGGGMENWYMAQDLGVQSSGGSDFYYDALDGLVLNNGDVISRNDLALSFMNEEEFKKAYPNGRIGNANYLGFSNGKHQVNFNITSYEVTAGNIRALAIHEIYGHGVMQWNDDYSNHYKAYWAVIDNVTYWNQTTTSFRKNHAYGMWLMWTNTGRRSRMPEKYMKVVDDYY